MAQMLYDPRHAPVLQLKPQLAWADLADFHVQVA